MHVQVRHTLAAVIAGVDNGPVPGLGDAQADRDLTRMAEQIPQQCCIAVHSMAERCQVLARNHQRVNRGLGRQIGKGDNGVVFCDELGAKAASCDLAKDAVRSGHAQRVLVWRAALPAAMRRLMRSIFLLRETLRRILRLTLPLPMRVSYPNPSQGRGFQNIVRLVQLARRPLPLSHKAEQKGPKVYSGNRRRVNSVGASAPRSS